MKNMCGRKSKSVSALVWVLMAVWPSARPAVGQSRAIADNSFLIEEAYNQEPGVVQHIGAWQRSLRSAPWLFTFTQEWPLGTQRHQLSYTLAFQRIDSPLRNSGLGDAAVNYRYQLLPATDRVALSPRVSLLLPTGRRERGLGTGEVGAQLNVPVSVTLGSSLVSHWNAGLGAVSRVTTYNLGASMIWLLRPSFNVVVEVAWTDQTAGPPSLVVNPGVRWAHNFAGGLQIVPGVAFPVGVGPSRGDRAAFLYLSFEHRFQNVQETLNPNTGPP
jgi:hypothetical protein